MKLLKTLDKAQLTAAFREMCSRSLEYNLATKLYPKQREPNAPRSGT